MKKLILLPIVLLATILSITSCKKDNPTKTQLLSDKNWKLTALTVFPGRDLSGTGVPVTDIYNYLPNGMSFIPACQKDDLMRFSSNGTYTTTDVGVVCTPDNSSAGSWEFNPGETLLLVIGGNMSNVSPSFLISSLTSSSFVATYTQVANSTTSTTYTYTITFTAQ